MIIAKILFGKVFCKNMKIRIFGEVARVVVDSTSLPQMYPP
jgi:hypothetical protein